MPKAYDLLILGNLLSITTEGEGGSIEQGLPRETCPSCSQAGCYRDCDGSQGADDTNESDEDAVGRAKYNAAVDALESLVLGHACAGVKVDDPKYVKGLETALDAFSNQF